MPILTLKFAHFALQIVPSVQATTQALLARNVSIAMLWTMAAVILTASVRDL